MAGISVNQESIREMLTCAICMEEFRSPRSLHCLHTFCQTCLGDYLFRKHVRPGTSFACPTCRETVVLPKQGVAGLRSNFLIQNMLGLLETKTEVPEEDVFTGDLLSLDDFPGNEAVASPKEDYEKSKRISQTQMLLFQAKEEKLKSTVAKARRHVDALQQYNAKVTATIEAMKISKENVGEKIKDRFQLIKDEVAKYETAQLEKIQNELDIEKESKPFQEEAAFVEEDVASLQSIIQFAEDVLKEGSLETMAAVTDDVGKNVNKTVKRELKQLDWESVEMEIPELNVAEHIGPVIERIGSLKKVKIVSDAVLPNDYLDSNPIQIQELEEESSRGKAKVSTTSNEELSPAGTVHSDPDGIRIYPKYLADEFLVSTPEEEIAPPSTDMFRGSPLALAGFDDVPRESPPIPLRSFEKEPTVRDSSPTQVRGEPSRQLRRDKDHVNRTHEASSSPFAERRHHRTAVKKKSPTKVFKLTLKLPPAVVTADLVGTLTTPLDVIHDIAITNDGDICVVGISSTKDNVYQSIALFKPSGAQKTWKRLNPFEPAFQGLISFATLNFKGQESLALPLPEDSRIRIVPIDDPENMSSVRTIFHKFKNMLYRPFHVCVFNGKIWAFGLDSFGRGSYDAKSTFDEWHPQCRVWDIETAETTEGPVKAETILIPSASPATYAKIEATTSTMYLCDKETVSAVRLADKGSLLWKFGETAKKKQKLKQAQGLCVDTSSGRVFVACQGGDRIVALSTEGQFLQTVASDKQGIKKPTSVALDATGQLVVGQANGYIKVFKMST